MTLVVLLRGDTFSQSGPWSHRHFGGNERGRADEHKNRSQHLLGTGGTRWFLLSPRRPSTLAMPSAYLGLGSNQGDRCSHLRAAVQHIRERAPTRVRAASPVYEAEAHTQSPDEEQPPFLNAVLHALVECDPATLLHVAHEIERAEGRVRSSTRTWEPRPLDIDLLAVDSLTCRTDALTLPHPRLGERRFVLQPWADLTPNFVVPPPFNEPVQSLLDQCPDAVPVRKTDCRLDDLVVRSSDSGKASG